MATTNAQFEALTQELKKRLGLIKHFAKLGDSDDLSSATIDEPGRKGYVRVRLEIDDVPYRTVKAGVIGGYSPYPGSPVVVGYDEKGALAIEKADFDGFLEAGGNPLVLNSADNRMTAFNQTDGLLPLFCGAVSGTLGTLTNEVFVNPWRFVDKSNNVQWFEGALLDLTALVPAANLHRYVAIFLKSDTLTFQLIGSTPIATITPLQESDKQICFDSRDLDTIPVALWRLENAQTVVTNANKVEDLRPWLMVQNSSLNNYAAIAAPIATDDIDSRYEVGSMWFDVTNDISYVCIDSTAGAAIWIELAGPNAGTIDTRYIAVTGDTATGQILIDLSSDEVGLAIEGDAAQTAELQQWRTSASEVGVAISPNAKALRFWDVGASHYVGFTPPALTATQLWVLPSADGAADQVLKTDGFGNLGWAAGGGGASPLTTKGDLYGYAAADARIPVGANGEALFADSTQALGVDWKAAPEISSQAGTPPGAPSYLADLNIDTTNDRVFGAANTSANTDWKRLDAGCVLLLNGTVSSDAASLTVSGWATDNNEYKNLILRVHGLRSDYTTNPDHLLVQFNSDSTATNYDSQTWYMRTTGTAALAYTGSVAGIIGRFAIAYRTTTAEYGSVMELVIPMPEDTGVYKTCRLICGSAAPRVGTNIGSQTMGVWESKAAITSIELLPYSGTTFEVGGAYGPATLDWQLYGEY